MSAWRLYPGAGELVDEAVVRPFLEWLEWSGFEPRRYDLNMREQWRPWELDRAVVDALTQRTLVFRVEGAGIFLLDLGKLREPVVIIETTGLEVGECFKRIPAVVRIEHESGVWERVLERQDADI